MTAVHGVGGTAAPAGLTLTPPHLPSTLSGGAKLLEPGGPFIFLSIFKWYRQQQGQWQLRHGRGTCCVHAVVCSEGVIMSVGVPGALMAC